MTLPTEKTKCQTINKISYKLSSEFNSKLQAVIKEWVDSNKIQKIWSKDKSVWTSTDEDKWLGWLNITHEQLSQINTFTNFAADVKSSGFTDAVVLGMGGSSLCPEVFSVTFKPNNGFPHLHILDSTSPEQIRALEKKIDLAKTLYVVSSKSGSTLEPNIFKQYFFEKTKQAIGQDKAGMRFIAITDPDSKMQKVAESDKFRNIFYGLPSIGGRYSALSNFGMIPAATMGVDVKSFLENTENMVQACLSNKSENPGLVLGAIMGVLTRDGCNKLTLITSPEIYDLGAWLEQLLAESTGKQGYGIIPVDKEEVGAPDDYSNDRLFVYLKLQSSQDTKQEQKVMSLESAGHPVIRIEIQDTYNLGQEFFRWELATAIAGSIIGINPFDQPDVEASKVATRDLTTAYEQTGQLPKEEPFFEFDGIKLFTDMANLKVLQQAAGDDKSLAGYIRAHINRLYIGDYLALLAYIEMNKHHEDALQSMRHLIRNKKKVATCLGFGPRFLHSTGQAYKGGPNSGVFLQITCDNEADLPVPNQKYTFGIVQAAQARGDFQVLSERKRRTLRVHLDKSVANSLLTLKTAITRALE